MSLVAKRVMGEPKYISTLKSKVHTTFLKNYIQDIQKKKTDTHITHPSHSKEERSWSFGQQMAFGLKL